MVWWWIEILNNHGHHRQQHALVVVWWWIEILNNQGERSIIIALVVVWWWIEILNNSIRLITLQRRVVVWWWIEILNNAWFSAVIAASLWFGDELRYWTTALWVTRCKVSCGLVMNWDIEQHHAWECPPSGCCGLVMNWDIEQPTHLFNCFLRRLWFGDELRYWTTWLVAVAINVPLWFGDELRYWTTMCEDRIDTIELWFGDELRYWTTNIMDIPRDFSCGLVMNWDIEQPPIAAASFPVSCGLVMNWDIEQQIPELTPLAGVVVWWWIEILNNDLAVEGDDVVVVVWWWIEILNNRPFCRRQQNSVVITNTWHLMSADPLVYSAEQDFSAENQSMGEGGCGFEFCVLCFVYRYIFT